MQDGYADVAAGVDVGVEDGGLEAHLRRHERVFSGESQAGAEEAAAVEFGVVVDHEHDFPLEDVVIDETAGYAGYVLVVLHLLELAGEEAGGGGGRRGHGGCGCECALRGAAGWLW